MNDRDLQVLEQYPFTVRGSFRVRGAFLLDTSEGRRLIREYSGSVQKLETEQKLLLHLSLIHIFVRIRSKKIRPQPAAACLSNSTSCPAPVYVAENLRKKWYIGVKHIKYDSD